MPTIALGVADTIMAGFGNVGFNRVYTFNHPGAKTNSGRLHLQGETHGFEETESEGIPKR
jgi:hypothetical protein